MLNNLLRAISIAALLSFSASALFFLQGLNNLIYAKQISDLDTALFSQIQVFMYGTWALLSLCALTSAIGSLTRRDTRHIQRP